MHYETEPGATATQLVRLSDRDRETGRKNGFRIAKQMTRKQQDMQGSPCMKDDEEKITTGSKGVKDIWQRYMEKLLNVENKWDGEVDVGSVQGPSCRITEEEVKKALKKMKPGKAGGPTGVVAEMSAVGHLSVEWLTTYSTTSSQKVRYQLTGQTVP